MGILLGEAAGGGVVGSRAEVVGAGFGVAVFPAIAEGVGVGCVRVLLAAEGVVGEYKNQRAEIFCSLIVVIRVEGCCLLFNV